MARRSILLIPVLAILFGCASEDKYEPRITALEKRVAELESTKKKQAEDEVSRAADFKWCVTTEANRVFDQALRINASSRNGSTYTVPVAAGENALRLKQAKIEECKLLYGPR